MLSEQEIEELKGKASRAISTVEVGKDTLSSLISALEEARKRELKTEAECKTLCDSYADENQRLHDRAEAAEAALKKIIEANDEFRAALPPEWDGDAVNDACQEARGIIASASGNPNPTKD